MGVYSTDSHKRAGTEKMCLMTVSCRWHIFLQIKVCIMCLLFAEHLEDIKWKGRLTSFSEHIFQQKKKTWVHRKALQMGKPGCNFAFSSCSLSTFSIFSILLHYLSVPCFFLFLFFSYFGKNIFKGREKQMHSSLTPIVSVIYEFWIWIGIETNQQMVGNMNIH